MGRSPGRRAAAALVAVSLLAPLENAGLAVSAAIVILALAWSWKGDLRGLPSRPSPPWRPPSRWAPGRARNEVALGRFVPLKSNFWFELHLANVDSADGLPRMETVLRRLPFFDTGEFGRYASMGEMAYVEGFREPAIAALRTDPWHFAGNVLRRLGAAAVFCRREGGGQSTDYRFRPEDQARLAGSGELITLGKAGALWARIDTPPNEERQKFRQLGLLDEAAVWQDWLEKRLAYDARFRGAGGTALGFLTAGVPVMALLFSALLSGGRMAAPARWAAAIAFGMLLPFVLVNHNERHQLPLLAMQAVAIGAFAQAAADLITRKSAAP